MSIEMLRLIYHLKLPSLQMTVLFSDTSHQVALQQVASTKGRVCDGFEIESGYPFKQKVVISGGTMWGLGTLGNAFKLHDYSVFFIYTLRFNNTRQAGSLEPKAILLALYTECTKH